MYIISFLPQSRSLKRIPGLLCDIKLCSSLGNNVGSVSSCGSGGMFRSRALPRGAVDVGKGDTVDVVVVGKGNAVDGVDDGKRVLISTCGSGELSMCCGWGPLLAGVLNGKGGGISWCTSITRVVFCIGFAGEIC